MWRGTLNARKSFGKCNDTAFQAKERDSLQGHALSRERVLIGIRAILGCSHRHASIAEVIATLDEQIAQVERNIRQHFDDHPDLKRRRDLLTSIPGIGETTAGPILSEIPHLDRFQSAEAVAAFAGLSPRERRSFGAISAGRDGPGSRPDGTRLARDHQGRSRTASDDRRMHSGTGRTAPYRRTHAAQSPGIELQASSEALKVIIGVRVTALGRSRTRAP
jgi:Transposase IS116/IS110/IS902 family